MYSENNFRLIYFQILFIEESFQRVVDKEKEVWYLEYKRFSSIVLLKKVFFIMMNKGVFRRLVYVVGLKNIKFRLRYIVLGMLFIERLGKSLIV